MGDPTCVTIGLRGLYDSSNQFWRAFQVGIPMAIPAYVCKVWFMDVAHHSLDRGNTSFSP